MILMYLAAIVAANLLVARFGPSVVVLNAFLFIGLDITTRDSLHDRWRADSGMYGCGTYNWTRRVHRPRGAVTA